MSLEPESLAHRFAARQLSRTEWTHEAHLTVGLWHVATLGPAEAMARLRSGIRKLNESNGVANTTSGGYHETITQAYVRLIAAFLASRPGDVSLQQTCDALLSGELADRNVLLRHWSRERLFSPLARAGWVEPDLAPLPPSES
ncbi:MAG: hypothetical protein ABW136_02030 [Steroidobacteraceae bacterium]